MADRGWVFYLCPVSMLAHIRPSSYSEMRREGVYSKMDVGSKEVLMESPPVSLIVCTCMCVCVYMCKSVSVYDGLFLLQPLWACFLTQIHSLH